MLRSSVASTGQVRSPQEFAIYKASPNKLHPSPQRKKKSSFVKCAEPDANDISIVVPAEDYKFQFLGVSSLHPILFLGQQQQVL